jgi:hypothetical protein
MRSDPINEASINDSGSISIPPIDSNFAIDSLPVTHFEDSIMDAIVCQAAEIVAAEAQTEEQVVTLSSTDMSYVGGGLMQVVFA